MQVVSVMFAALDAKYTGIGDAKAENDALRDDVLLTDGRPVLHIKAVYGQCVKPPPPRRG